MPGGMKTLVAALLNGLPPELVELKREVVKISYSDDLVKVLVKDGEEYTADYVISTLPIGVLKKHHDTMFEPSLPRRMVSSERLGKNRKVILSFSFFRLKLF